MNLRKLPWRKTAGNLSRQARQETLHRIVLVHVG
jgi:hypothetical protein